MKKLLLFATAMLFMVALFAQRTITGRVTDENGSPVVNGSVTVKETGIGVTTDGSGGFSIQVDARARILVFSYVGKGTVEELIGNRSAFNVTLRPNTVTESEVVVVAYGTQVKKKLTGSISTVASAELENRAQSSVDRILQGKVAGLQSVASNGQPGGPQTIRIRGVSSVTGGNDPLFVVDGIPIGTGDFSRLINTSNALAGINPNDIESVSVLKDAASASLYGSRAANGVILITTKKGRVGKSKIRADVEFGFSDIAAVPDIGRPLNYDEYYALLEEGLINAGATPAQVSSIKASNGFGSGANTDWFDLVTRTGRYRSYNASVSGGDAKTTFYGSIGYRQEEAAVITSSFERFTANINVRHKASDKLSVAFNLLGSYDKTAAPTQAAQFRNPVLAAYALRPGVAAYNPDGTLNSNNSIFNQIYNPLVIADLDRERYDNVKVISTFTLEYNILKNLKYTSKFGIDYINLEEILYWNPFHGDARLSGGQSANYNTRWFNWVWTNMLDYHHDFLKSKDLGMDVKIGYEAQKMMTYNVSADGTGLPLTSLIILPTPTVPGSASGAKTDEGLAAIIGQVQFDYKRRYSLSGSFRRDGSSRFPEISRWGNFLSVGAAWNIDEEKFMNNATFVDALKLRASYGENGNNTGTGLYSWRPTFAAGGGTSYNQLPGGAVNSHGTAPDLTWEKNKVINFAVDFSLFKDRVGGTIEYYRRTTSDLIFGVPVSRTAGSGTAINDNVGEMVNKGWEFQINTVPVRTKDFRWDLGFMIALNRNEITKLPNGDDILSGNQIRRLGQNVSSFYTRLWAGVNPQTGAAQWYSDANKTIVTAPNVPAYREIIGQAMPKGFGSVSTTVTYKEFSLDAQFNFQYGNMIYDNWGFIMWSDGAFPTLNKIRKQLNRWQNPGDIADLPRYVYNNNTLSNAESSRWYYRGDFVRLRELTLNYQVPKSLLDKARITNASVYIKGANFWTHIFDKNVPFDPEIGFNGTADFQVMNPRIISLGITLGF